MELKFDFSKEDSSTFSELSELSALIDADSSFYASWDEHEHLITASSHAGKFSLPALMDTRPMESKKTKVAILNSLFTLVPNAEFDFDSIESYLKFNVSISQEKNLLFRTEQSELWDLRIVYAVSKSLIKEINTLGEQTSLFHLVTAMIDHIRPQQDSKWSIHNCILNQKTVVLVHREGKLRLANVYMTEEPLSLLYYNSLITHQLRIKKSELSIGLSGMVQNEDAYYKLLHKYFNTIHFESLQDSDFPASHRYLPLYCIKKCA